MITLLSYNKTEGILRVALDGKVQSLEVPEFWYRRLQKWLDIGKLGQVERFLTSCPKSLCSKIEHK